MNNLERVIIYNTTWICIYQLVNTFLGHERSIKLKITLKKFSSGPPEPPSPLETFAPIEQKFMVRHWWEHGVFGLLELAMCHCWYYNTVFLSSTGNGFVFIILDNYILMDKNIFRYKLVDTPVLLVNFEYNDKLKKLTHDIYGNPLSG